MRLSIFIAMLAALTLWVCSVFAQVDKGAEQMLLESGVQAAVPFPHGRHQAALDDCLVCHSLFSQERGSISRAVADGELAKQQVMNKLCIQCHRSDKQAGRQSGPVTCAKCHMK